MTDFTAQAPLFPRLLSAPLAGTIPDLSITGTLHAFLLLAARREDTDTLFFQRRLRMEGNTELGLEVKNFLYGLDVDALWLPRPVSSEARRTLPFYERIFSQAITP